MKPSNSHDPSLPTSSIVRQVTGLSNFKILTLLLLVVTVGHFMGSSDHTHCSGLEQLKKPTENVMDGDKLVAYHDSFGFFDDITDEDWERRRAYARSKLMYNIGKWKHPKFWDEAHKWYYHNIDPYFSCPNRERVGGLGDGPKWMCDPYRLRKVVERRQKMAMATGQTQNTHCLVYSIGSNGNYLWEDAVYDILGGPICEIHIFDFSGDFDRRENTRKNMHFHKIGLQGTQENRKDGNFLSFPQILDKLGHVNKTIDLFKIDCEKCEWTSYKDWISHDLRQIMIETHGLPQDVAEGEHYFDSFRKNNLVLFSKEANPHCGGGRCVELSFIKLHPNFLSLSDKTTKS